MSRPKPRPNAALANPDAAALVLARYRRLMRRLILALVGTVMAAAVLILKHRPAGSARLAIALALGIAFAMLLASALLGRALLARGKNPPGDDAPG